MTITNWFAAQTYLGGKTNRPDPQYGHNTRIVKVDDSFAIKLHNTNVVTFNSDGSITLNSNDWRTVVTRNRIDDVLAAYGLQVVGSLAPYTKTPWTVVCCTVEVPFHDGMTLDAKMLEGFRELKEGLVRS